MLQFASFSHKCKLCFWTFSPYPYHAQFSETFISDFQLDSQNQYRNPLNYNLTTAKIKSLKLSEFKWKTHLQPQCYRGSVCGKPFCNIKIPNDGDHNTKFIKRVVKWWWRTFVLPWKCQPESMVQDKTCQVSHLLRTAFLMPVPYCKLCWQKASNRIKLLRLHFFGLYTIKDTG